ncbi:MAG: phage tail protein [Lachnospiraceae bacterium]
MPQPFNNAVITNAGAQVITRAQAGEETRIEFTHIAIGDGVYEESEKTMQFLQGQTALRSQKNIYALSDINIHSEHSVKVTALITNQNPATGETLIDEGYFINEMGLFAKIWEGENCTEILYSIAITSGEHGDFMPPYNGYNPAQIIQDYFATVSNSADITINTKGAVPTIEQMEAALDNKADLDGNGKLLKSQMPLTEFEQQLPAGETSITFTLEGLSDNSSISVYADVPGVGYTDIVVDGDNVTITFEAQEQDIQVKVVVADGMV